MYAASKVFQGNRERRRRNFLQNLYFYYRRSKLKTQLILFLLSSRMAQRRYWMTCYDQNWFRNLWAIRNNQIAAELFKKEFRVSPQTFQEIINIVTRPMIRQNTMLRDAIPLEKRVAVAIWRLSTGNSYRVVAKAFGVGIKSVHVILLEFCYTLKIMSGHYIRFPTTEVETSLEILKFKNMTGTVIPQVVGCIDGTHIEITCPSIPNKDDYFCRKQYYSINTQAVVGGKLMFLDVATGFPGCMHDARVLRNTSLFHNANNGSILNEPSCQVMGYTVKPFLLGDSAYQPLQWIVKPYTRHRQLTREERKYNRIISQSRSVVERGFGMLKVRWRCLLKALEQGIQHIPAIITACCVLHNICQKNNEELDQDDNVLLQQIIRDLRNRNPQYVTQ